MVYVDTSVIVAMLTNEPASAACIDWFNDLTQTPISSDWLITEFNSAIGLKTRTAQLQNHHAQAILQQFNTLLGGGIKLMPIHREAFNQAGQLVRQHTGARAGDALHLAVALACDAKIFVTLDKTQANTAQQLNLQLVVLAQKT